MNLNTLKPAYFKVGYSILTPSYYQSAGCVGFRNDSESTAFYADCERIFRAGGWNVERGYAINGNSKLHLHPQQFLGVVQTELIDTIPDSSRRQICSRSSRTANGSSKRFTISRRTSSRNILPPGVRRLKRNYSRDFALRNGNCITSLMDCCCWTLSCSDEDMAFRH